MSWHDPEQNEYARLEDLIDQNRPLTEIFRPWPFWYFIHESRWPDLMRLIGVEYDPERCWPYWVDFEGAVIFRVPRHFIKHIDAQEAYETEQSVLIPAGSGLGRPLLPQEEWDDAVYVRAGTVTVYRPGQRRPAGERT